MFPVLAGALLAVLAGALTTSGGAPADSGGRPPHATTSNADMAAIPISGPRRLMYSGRRNPSARLHQHQEAASAVSSRSSVAWIPLRLRSGNPSSSSRKGSTTVE